MSQSIASDGRGNAPLGSALVYGFGTAVAVWIMWFITHLPWAGVPERTSIIALLLVWLAGMIAAGMGVPKGRGWLVGGMAGAVTALVGLLVLGSKLTEAPAEGANAAGSVRPNAAMVVGGFLALGCVLGVIGGVIGNLVRPSTKRAQAVWLSRFAIVAAAAVTPLLFVGGLVTSTGSGMAVPDWPGTFGSSMFLYPLGPRARPDVYLEHSHRLFGILVGLTTIVLMVWVLLADPRRWLKGMAVAALVLVSVQGVMGGLRVTENSAALAMLHGVLAQLVFGVLVAIAVCLSPTWRTASGRCLCGYDLGGLPSGDGQITCPECGRLNYDHSAAAAEASSPGARRGKFFATGALHATVLQLLFGAAYRHFSTGKGATHTLWTHVAFSFVVLLFALAAGFVLVSLKNRYAGIGPVLRRVGWALLIVVSVQFILGWGAFAYVGRPRDTGAIMTTLIRTAHQANGALLLAAALMGAMWSKRLARLARTP